MSTMLNRMQAAFERFLRSTERYTKTDMVYLAHNGFWLVVGQGGAIILTLALATAFGHLATQDAYGNYKYVLTLAGLLGTLTLSGLATGLTQSTAKGYDGALRQAVRLNLRWSVGLVLVALGAAVYYFAFAHNIYLALSLVIIAVFMPFLNGFSLYDSFLIGKKKFRRDTLYYLAENAFLTTCLIVTIFVSTRAILLVLVYFLASTLMNAFFYRASLRVAENDKEDPELLTYSTHLSVLSIVGAITDKIDSIAVFSMLGPAQLGIYAFAIAIPEQIKGALKNVIPLSMPKFAERSIGEIKRTVGKRIFILAFALTLLVLLYVALVPFIFKLLFPVYTESIRYSQVFAFSLIFTACTAPLISVLQAHKKTKALYIITNVSSVFLIVTLPVLAFFYGIWGAILSQFIYRSVRMSLAGWQFISIKESN